MSTAQLGQIVEDSAAEIYIFDSGTFRFRLVNRGARENLQYTASELRNLCPWDLMPEFDEVSFNRLVEPLAQGEVSELKFETHHQRKDETGYDVHVHLQMIRSGEEDVFFAAIRDISDEHRLAEELQARKIELEEALETKEVLLHEVNHRVKNSLQIVTSLLQLQANQTRNQELKRALSEARGRVAVVATIHQKLYSTSQHTMVDFGEFLSELVEQTISHLDLDGRIKSVCNLQDNVSISITKGVPLALIVSEILTNCTKYAFPDERAGTLQVDMHSDSDKLHLRIADDGVGLSQPFGSPEGLGLGTRIIKALSQQVRAELEVDSSDNGTVFGITMPMNGKAKV